MYKKLSALWIVALLSIGLSFGLEQKVPSPQVNPVSISISDNVSIIIIRNGEIIYHYDTHNFVTNIGLDYCEQQLGGTPTSAAIYASLSTSSQAPLHTWTILPDEITTGGLARGPGTYTSLSVGQWKIEKTFTATTSFTGVQISGLHWASSGDNNLYAVCTMPSANLQTNDMLVIQWQITLSRAT